jgi:arylamine N-acetyltransferase
MQMNWRLSMIISKRQVDMAFISNSMAFDILKYLGCPLKNPTLRYLNQLVHTYIRRVPWESVSRIIKRHSTAETKNCPRLPEEFWNDAMRYGLGGTCFESSLAFYSLLTTLSYECYLTVNDMGESRGCHAAIVVLFAGYKYLVDITIPVHAAVRIDPQKIVKRRSALFDYTLRPISDNKYEVERSHRPRKNLFTLIDRPVSLPDYLAIVENDYTETAGHFLKSVVMTKVVDERAQRFFSDHLPYKLESFDRSVRIEKTLEPENFPLVLAELFQMPEGSISAALSLI